MTDMKSSDSIDDTIELMGYWYLPSPGKEPCKVPGTLTFKDGEKSELILIGSLEDNKDSSLKRYDVIIGECFPGVYVTIFDGRIRKVNTRLGIPGLMKTEIVVNRFWMGNTYFEHEADIELESFQFGISNLECWHNINCFNSTCDFDERIAIYTPPVPTELFEDENVKIEMVYSPSGPNRTISQTSITIEHCARIRISAKHGKLNFYEGNSSISYYHGIIFAFIRLCQGGNAYEFDLNGVIEPFDKTPEGKNIPTTEVKFFYTRSITLPQLKELNFYDMFLPYNNIKDNIHEVLKKFVAEYQKLAVSIDGLFKFFATQAYSFGTLPELVYTFEGLIGELYANELKAFINNQGNTPADIEVRTAILNNCTDSQRFWIGKRLNHPIRLKVKFRFQFKRLERCFSYLSPDMSEDLIEYFISKRDSYAHGTRGEFANHEFYVCSAKWLGLFLIATIMQYCGLLDQILMQSLDHYPEHLWDKNIMIQQLPDAIKEIKDNYRKNDAQ